MKKEYVWKVGMEVVYWSKQHKLAMMVEIVTPTGRVITHLCKDPRKKYRFNADGSEIGKNKYDMGWIYPLTKELQKELSLRNRKGA